MGSKKTQQNPQSSKTQQNQHIFIPEVPNSISWKFKL